MVYVDERFRLNASLCSINLKTGHRQKFLSSEQCFYDQTIVFSVVFNENYIERLSSVTWYNLRWPWKERKHFALLRFVVVLTDKCVAQNIFSNSLYAFFSSNLNCLVVIGKACFKIKKNRVLNQQNYRERCCDGCLKKVLDTRHQTKPYNCWA